jgi:hypothetical protein
MESDPFQTLAHDRRHTVSLCVVGSWLATKSCPQERKHMKDEYQHAVDLEGLLSSLSRRKHWSRVAPNVLRQLFENAVAAPPFPSNAPYNWSEPAIQILKRTIHLSEVFNAVQQKWIPFARGEDPKEDLAMVSASFEDLGYQLFDEAQNLAGGKRTRDFGRDFKSMVKGVVKQTGQHEINIHLQTADWVYQAALICDPFALHVFGSLAGLYMLGESEILRNCAVATCLLYDRADEQLQNANVAALPIRSRLLKENHNSQLSKVRENTDNIKKILGMPVTDRQV